MATDTRIYRVTPKVAEEGKPVPVRLVRAASPARVRAHIARGFNVGLPSQEELMADGKAGIAVEEASDDPDLD